MVLENDRGDVCFICLDQSDHDLLKSSCSQCSAVVHDKCWTKLLKTQQLKMLRARLLNDDYFDINLCTVCRTGQSQNIDSVIVPIDEMQNKLLRQVTLLATSVYEQNSGIIELVEESREDENSVCSNVILIVNLMVFSLSIVALIMAFQFSTYLPGQIIIIWGFCLYYFFAVQVIILLVSYRFRLLSVIEEVTT